jgi:ribosomal protein S18 acetylase RimI-like enzyme
MWHTLRLTRPTEIAAFLRDDRLYAAYALGDLEPEFFQQSDWFGAERDGTLATLVLVYRGTNPPVLFVMGEPEGLVLLLATAVREPRVLFMTQEQHLSVLRTFYRMFEPAPMWRMAVRASTFKPSPSDRVRRLYPGDTRQLEALYDKAKTQPGEEIVAFTPSQVAQGVFFGVRASAVLVAAAGTHLVSRARKIAVVGNVFTHPAHRRHGYATACTAAVTAALLAEEMVDVVLNVAQDNATALGIYERLGYARVCPFYEGLGVRKGLR